MKIVAQKLLDRIEKLEKDNRHDGYREMMQLIADLQVQAVSDLKRINKLESQINSDRANSIPQEKCSYGFEYCSCDKGPRNIEHSQKDSESVTCRTCQDTKKIQIMTLQLPPTYIDVPCHACYPACIRPHQDAAPNVPKKKKITLWTNVYKYEDGTIRLGNPYQDKEASKKDASPKYYIGTFPIEIEVEEALS